MGYAVAIDKAWEDLSILKPAENLSVRFLADEYSVDLNNRRVLSVACNVLAGDYTVILILHYLNQKLKGLPDLTGEWLDFKALSGIEGYMAAFRPSGNILFDKSITKIFCTEDIVVLAGIIASQL